MTRHGALGLRTVAVFEAAKGLLVLVAGFGLLSLLHRDVERTAIALVHGLHLNPARHAPRIFLEAAARMTDGRLWLLALGAVAYSSLRFAEAFGLWRARAWAEWLAIVSGGLYLPVEVYELLHRPTVLRALVLGANAVIVAYVAYVRLADPERPAPTA